MNPSGRHGPGTASPGGIAFTVALLAVTVLLLATTAGLRASAAVVPRAVGVPLAILLAYRSIRDIVEFYRARGATTERPGQTPGEAAADRTGRTASETAAVLWLLALPALATVLGFIAGPAIWVTAWARFRAHERTMVAIGAGALTALGVFGIFGTLLGARLPPGLFGG